MPRNWQNAVLRASYPPKRVYTRNGQVMVGPAQRRSKRQKVGILLCVHPAHTHVAGAFGSLKFLHQPVFGEIAPSKNEQLPNS